MNDPVRHPPAYLSHADLDALPEVHVRHPLNDNSDVSLRRLSEITGLKRLALYLARVPPGKESFVYHHHERAEEFLFILSGRGRAEIGDAIVEVEPGDFMGFPAPDGPAHHLLNPYDEDLVYLMGGERPDLDIGYFPRLERRMVFTSSGVLSVPDAACEMMTIERWLSGSKAHQDE